MIHDADYQMSLSCGQDDPLNILKNSFFSCLIDFYFSPFFFEHTVCPYFMGEGGGQEIYQNVLIYYFLI